MARRARQQAWEVAAALAARWRGGVAFSGAPYGAPVQAPQPRCLESREPAHVTCAILPRRQPNQHSEGRSRPLDMGTHEALRFLI